MNKKTYILDTNVLLSDANSINSFEEHDVIIPLAVLEELDNKKSRQDEVGRNARQVCRTLDVLREKGSLSSGVELENGGTLRVLATKTDITNKLPSELVTTKVDNIIVAFALEHKNSVLVSKDINVRVKCDALGIKSEDYLKMRIANNQDEFYGGVSKIFLPFEDVDAFYNGEPVLLPPEILSQTTLQPNENLVIKDHNEIKSALARFVSPTQPLKQLHKSTEVFGLTPRNKEQQFALDMLLDPGIKLLTLVGNAGCGKTLLAVAAGLQQVVGNGKYEKLIISRPVQPVGKDIGFLPGTLEEKMEPWIAPIKDNLNFLVGNKFGGKKIKIKKDGDDKTVAFKRDPYLERLFEDGRIEVEALAFIRGRSIPNSFIIIDEAQNLTVHELKTIITRVGDNTKIVITGDINQIDNVHVDMFSNGLTYAIEKFKEYNIAGHITLIKGERSELATLAAKIL